MHLFVFVVLMNAMILVPSCIIPLKALADGAVGSLSNLKMLLNSASGALKAIS